MIAWRELGHFLVALSFVCVAAFAGGAWAQEPESIVPESTSPVPATTNVVTAPPTPVIVNVPSPFEPPQPVEGLWLTTDFPAIAQEAGDDVRFALRLQNRNLAPRRVELTVEGLPQGWAYEIEGGGRPVTAAFAGLDQSVDMSLRLVPPLGVRPGRYDFVVMGHASPDRLELPISLTIEEAVGSSLALEPALETLSGASRASFDFEVAARNEGNESRVFALSAVAAPGFETVFSVDGGEPVTGLPIRPGETRNLTVSVRPPPDARAGQYPVVVRISGPRGAAEAKLVVEVTGRPELSFIGPEGRLSGDATAGRERQFGFVLRNGGSAHSPPISLTASGPASWRVSVDPSRIAGIAPGEELPISLGVTPGERAIAGDYLVSVRASNDFGSTNADFRVTVLTSTLWGIAGLGVIGAAVIVLAVAVTRYGRR